MKIIIVAALLCLGYSNASGNIRHETRNLQEDCPPSFEFLDNGNIRAFSSFNFCSFPIYLEFPIPDDADFLEQERPDESIFEKLKGKPGEYIIYDVADDCEPINPYSVVLQRGGGNAAFNTPVDGPFEENTAIKKTGEVFVIVGDSTDVSEVPFEANKLYLVRGKVEYTLGVSFSTFSQQTTYTKVTGQVINLCDQLQG